jgi:hypothetical protein
MSCADPRFAELVAGRVLDALEPGDEAVVEAHLPACSDCRALYVQLSATAAGLAHGVDDVDPPAALWSRIRAELPEHAHSAPLATPISLAARRRRSLPGAVRISPRVGVRFAAGIAAAAVVLSGGYALHLRSSRDHAETALSQSQAVLGNLQDAGAYSVPLASRGGAATGTAVVDGNQVDLITRNLGRNDTSSSIYVLWAASPQSPTMVAVAGFDVSTDGDTVVHATLPAGLTDPTIFGVTHEKGRSLPATPGGNPVLRLIVCR